MVHSQLYGDKPRFTSDVVSQMSSVSMYPVRSREAGAGKLSCSGSERGGRQCGKVPGSCVAIGWPLD